MLRSITGSLFLFVLLFLPFSPTARALELSGAAKIAVPNMHPTGNLCVYNPPGADNYECTLKTSSIVSMSYGTHPPAAPGTPWKALLFLKDAQGRVVRIESRGVDPTPVEICQQMALKVFNGVNPNLLLRVNAIFDSDAPETAERVTKNNEFWVLLEDTPSSASNLSCGLEPAP